MGREGVGRRGFDEEQETELVGAASSGRRQMAASGEDGASREFGSGRHALVGAPTSELGPWQPPRAGFLGPCHCEQGA